MKDVGEWLELGELWEWDVLGVIGKVSIVIKRGIYWNWGYGMILMNVVVLEVRWVEG